MYRTHCVLCNCSLSELFVLRDFPIKATYNSYNKTDEEFTDSTHATCTQCGNIQLSTLIELESLYKDSHNSTGHSPVWIEHHKKFSEFIITFADTLCILEIGGNTGVLYNHLKDDFTSYSILDICDSEKRPSSIKYIQGDCESFDYTGISCIAMSHTFEHLYSPTNFIEKIYRASVPSVFISIPNMDEMYKNKYLHIISNEHTFFVGDNEIRYLFSKFNYKCAETFVFKGHSYFYKFVYDKDTPLLTLYNTIQRSNDIKNIVVDFESYLGTIDINIPFYICPAGAYGQKVYYYLNKKYSSIMGFIDNDQNKQGKRLFGTDLNVYSPNILLDNQNEKICIVLCGTVYTDEIQEQLKNVHTNLNFIRLRGF
jgi:hypothetical protein